jgi:hypothetical protein
MCQRFLSTVVLASALVLALSACGPNNTPITATQLEGESALSNGVQHPFENASPAPYHPEAPLSGLWTASLAAEGLGERVVFKLDLSFAGEICDYGWMGTYKTWESDGVQYLETQSKYARQRYSYRIEHEQLFLENLRTGAAARYYRTTEAPGC